jgi:hypothetical protein
MFLAWYVKSLPSATPQGAHLEAVLQDRDALWQPEAICVMVVDPTVVFLTGRVRLGLAWSREIA